MVIQHEQFIPIPSLKAKHVERGLLDARNLPTLWTRGSPLHNDHRKRKHISEKHKGTGGGSKRRSPSVMRGLELNKIKMEKLRSMRCFLGNCSRDATDQCRQITLVCSKNGSPQSFKMNIQIHQTSGRKGNQDLHLRVMRCILNSQPNFSCRHG